jgi:hypothetical protein
MRAGIIAAAFAATVLAVPMEKRDVVTNTDLEVVYVTQYTTVTGGDSQPTEAAPTKKNVGGHWGHGPHWWGGNPNKGHTKEPAPTTTSYQATWEPSPTKSKQSKTKTTPESQPTQTSTGPSGGYQQTVIDQHNYHRKNHSAPDIAWDSILAGNAAKVAASCVYAHNT